MRRAGKGVSRGRSSQPEPRTPCPPGSSRKADGGHGAHVSSLQRAIQLAPLPALRRRSLIPDNITAPVFSTGAARQTAGPPQRLAALADALHVTEFVADG